MAPPATPAVTVLPEKPPIRLGLAALGCRRKARWLFTRRSRATLSVVPTKWVPAVVPALPPRTQGSVSRDEQAGVAGAPAHRARRPGRAAS